MPFENPIIAGEELIRSGMKSKDYLTGVSGWRIGRNGDAEFNNVQIRGTILATAARATLADSVNGQVVSANLDGRSTNYVEGDTGWFIGPDGTAEFENMAIRNTIAAVDGNFGAVAIGGDDQATINLEAGGNIAQNLAWAVGDETWVGAGPHKLAQIQCELKANHYYLVMAHGLSVGSTIANDVITASFRYEDGGVVPIGTSTVVHGSVQNVVKNPYVVGQREHVMMFAWTANLTAAVITRTFGLFLQRTAGTGNVISNSVNGGRVVVIDMGVIVESSGTKFAPAGSTVSPRRFTQEWSHTDIQSYQANGTVSVASGANFKGYQGDGTTVGNPGGNHGSMFIFDWASISAALAGATIIRCYLYADNTHSYLYSGITAVFGTHTQVAVPVNFSGTQNRWQLTGIPKGGSKWTADLGVTLGNELKAGTTKGILLGRGPTTSPNYYGYFSKVKIKIVYDK